jgi:hypothetical protein
LNFVLIETKIEIGLHTAAQHITPHHITERILFINNIVSTKATTTSFQSSQSPNPFRIESGFVFVQWGAVWLIGVY